jgi:hypothetical protein
MRSSGLLGVSIQQSAAGIASAASQASALPKSTKSTAKSPRRCHAEAARKVPP